MDTDCATVIEYKPTENIYITSHYKARIKDDDKTLVDLLIKKIKSENRKASMNDSSVRQIVREKIYESIAWPGKTAGTKHFAAASFLYRNPDARFAIDIFSRTGIYTRIQKEPKEITITHVMPQRLDKFEQIDPAFVIGNNEQFVLYCVRYKRNNNLSVNRQVPWVDVTYEWIADLNDPSTGIRVNKLAKKTTYITE